MPATTEVTARDLAAAGSVAVPDRVEVVMLMADAFLEEGRYTT
jgi:hypothetical protein